MVHNALQNYFDFQHVHRNTICSTFDASWNFENKHTSQKVKNSGKITFQLEEYYRRTSWRFFFDEHVTLTDLNLAYDQLLLENGYWCKVFKKERKASSIWQDDTFYKFFWTISLNSNHQQSRIMIIPSTDKNLAVQQK